MIKVGKIKKYTSSKIIAIFLTAVIILSVLAGVAQAGVTFNESESTEDGSLLVFDIERDVYPLSAEKAREIADRDIIPKLKEYKSDAEDYYDSEPNWFSSEYSFTDLIAMDLWFHWNVEFRDPDIGYTRDFISARVPDWMLRHVLKPMLDHFFKHAGDEDTTDPGNDHPDENYDVSTPKILDKITLNNTFEQEMEFEIAVLSKGFLFDTVKLLGSFNDPSIPVDITFSPDLVKDRFPTLIIPSGGLYGLDSLLSFKSNLEHYVKNGGTLIVFSQQHGYEYSALPGGNLSGFGWIEDQSCHHRSVYIDTYHPILSGQDSVTSDVNVDGYFTRYPENATILLSRTKNGMPAMLMHEYGKGRVIASTLYTDWAYTHYQSTTDGKKLIRDLITWAKDPKNIPDYAHGDAINIPINITNNANATVDNVSFKVRDPDKNVVGYVNVTNVSILPNETKIINFTYTAPSKLGIWRIDYSLLNNSNVTQTVYEVQRFAVSKYAENPEGFVYHGKDITFTVSSPEEQYAYGSDVPFTIHIYNHRDVDRNISFTTCYKDWMLSTKLPEQNVEGNLIVPAGGEASFTHILHVGDIYLSHNQLITYASFNENGSYLGRTEKVVWMFHPSVSVHVETDQKEYARGENVSVLLNLTNKRNADCNTTITVRTLDPDNKKVFEDSLNVNLSAYESLNKTLSFTLPITSEYGIYLVTAEAYSNGNKIGSGSTYFEVLKDYIVKVNFDKADKAYRIRENLSIDLEITNIGSALWNSTINTSIPDLVFEDSKYITLNPNQTEKISYNLSIPETTPAGKHDIIVTISFDNSMKQYYFVIPDSKLVLSCDKMSYNAGEYLYFNLTNIGGVDTTCNCTIKFYDSHRFRIYENTTQENIPAGEGKVLEFKIPEQAVSGDYYLVVECEDLNTSKVTRLSKSYTISGIKAFLTSSTDKKTYYINENITLYTNITNLDGEINNGLVEIEIFSRGRGVSSEIGDSIGREFFVVNTDNLHDGIGCSIFVTSEVDTTGFVEIPGIAFYQSFTVTSNTITTVNIPTSAEVSGSDNIENKGIHILADDEVTVYFLNPGTPVYSNDAYLCLPLDTLNVEYIVLGYEETISTGNHIGGPSEFAIVAPYNDTTVTITPSITTGSRTAGVPYTIVLDRFQTYTLQGDNPREDLTGTIIESSHPIAVFAGVRCCFIPANFYACDHIVEQMIPVAAWGKDFDTFPFMPRQNGLGDFLRILASVNGTLVKINGATVGTIDRGDFLETTVTEPLEISTSHPVLVAQYLTSEDYEGRIGDPFECLIPPTEQFLPRYTFITPTGYAENYVNIVTPTTSLDDLVLDGSPVNTSVFTDFGTRGLSAGTIPLTEGTHTITGITSFGIYVYGYNQYVSYGYPGGLALRKLREELVWYKNITINLTDFEIQNLFTNINIPEELENVTGKLNVIATLYSNTSQIINQSEIYSFYITDKNVSLTLETDKEKYKPNEPVTIYASAQNIGNITESYNLSLTKDGVEIYSDSFTLDPDEVYTYTVITASNTTFTLEALVEGVYVSDVINIETPNINVNLIVPEVVGLSPFDIGVLIENIGNIDVQINIQLNSNIWNISIPQGETRLIETTMSITENTTIYVIISGDVNQIIQKQIICGENAKINIIPQPTYLEDTLEIPYNIKNIGILDSEFNATFSINDQILTRNFFVPRGQNISDSVSFNLTRGTHLLRYISPFEDVNVTINVVSPPEFIVTSILPANMNFTLGQNVTLTFVVENIGGTEGEATLSLFMPDFEDTNRTWIRPGDEENISFSLTIPDDLEEKSYKGIYELDGERNEFMFFVQGIKISVDASLDKPLYEESETAIFTLNLGVPILSDPNEGNLVDIKQVFANTNETDVNFQVETYTSIIEEAYGIMWLDTDQNSSTGATDEWWPEYGLNDIGAEYAVAMEIGIQYNEAYLYQWTGYDFIEISHLPITLNEYYFTFLVPLSDIANDSDMDVTLMMEDYYGGIDIAPNEGHGTIGGFGLSLYARVKLSDYEEVKHFNLTDFETLQFDVPVHFNGQKLFYGIYMESGRALYLNAMYVHKKEIITLYTDKQVYNAGENVTIFVDTTKSGTLNITAPGFNTSIFVTGSTTLEFTLPKEVKSGTYYIDYTFDNFSSAYPFDVIGYSARILECSLDKEVYDPVDVVNIKMNVEVNQNISGSLKMWIYDPQDNPIDTFETDKNFMRGENKIEVMRDLSTNFSGIHVLVYGVYAHSDLILLASGAEYFDVEGVPDTIPPAISSENPRHNSFDVARPPAELNATVEDPDGDTMLVYIRWRNHDGDWVTLETYAGVYNGTYNFVPPSENDWIWGDTTYTWSVHVTDGVAWTNETYQYTTGGSRYDVSNNDLVNFQDAGLVWVHRTSEVPYDGLYDVNSDGQVNFQDAGLTWINRD